MIALHHTSVANTLVILAASPFAAAILSKIVLKEAVPLQTWIAISAGFFGIAVTISDTLLNSHSHESLPGDAAAMVTAVMLAASFVLIRRRKDINMVPATALGGYIAAGIALPFIAYPIYLEGQQIGLLLLLCVGILPISFAFIALGPRKIPAPEVSLLMLLETVLGPVWVWVFLNEAPTTLALSGGAIVLGSLMLHAIWRMLRKPLPHSAG